MILSGLQAAAGVLVPSSGIDRRRPQWGRSAAEGLAANFHGHVIKPDGLRRACPAMAARQGRQIAPDARRRHPVEMSLDFGRS
jgi:hypothetical protein